MPPRARTAQRTATRSPQRATKAAAPASTEAAVTEAPVPDAAPDPVLFEIETPVHPVDLVKKPTRWIASRTFVINGREVRRGTSVPEVDDLTRPEALLRHRYVRLVPQGGVRV